MIISRAIPALQAGRHVAKHLILNSKQSPAVKNNIRWEGQWTYRKLPDASPKDWRCAEILLSFTWCWIFWHLFMNYDEVIGPRMPDPSKWTDEELGVPPL